MGLPQVLQQWAHLAALTQSPSGWVCLRCWGTSQKGCMLALFGVELPYLGAGWPQVLGHLAEGVRCVVEQAAEELRLTKAR